MAKRGASKGAVTEGTMGGFAADLGKILGTVQGKASGWLDQRNAIADQLTRIRDTANDYCSSGPAAGRTWRLRSDADGAAVRLAPATRGARPRRRLAVLRQARLLPRAPRRSAPCRRRRAKGFLRRRRLAGAKQRKGSGKAKGLGRGSEIGNG